MSLPPDPAPPVLAAGGALAELAQKYQRLLALDSEAPAGRNERRRQALRAVAERFPTALRERDALPRRELARRLQVVTQALAAAQAHGADGEAQSLAMIATTERWLAYALDLHAHLRALLTLRRHLVTRPPSAAAEDLRAGAALWDSPLSGPLSATLLERVRTPPAGGLTDMAYADVAARHGVTVAMVKDALFTVPATPPGADREAPSAAAVDREAPRGAAVVDREAPSAAVVNPASAPDPRGPGAPCASRLP